MAHAHRPSPLRLSDTAWATNVILDQPRSADARTGGSSSSSSLDLVPAPRASDLQIVLRTRDHAAYYDAVSNELSLQKHPMRSRSPDESRASSHDDAPLVPHRGSRNVLQQFHRAEPLRNSTGESICPICARPWPIHEENLDAHFDTDYPSTQADHESPAFIAPNYFRLLAQASTNTTNTSTTALPDSSFSPASRPPTPRNRFSSVSGTSTPQPPSSGTSSPPPEPLSQTSSAQGYYSRFFIELHQLGRGARGTVYLCQHVLNGNKLGKYAVKKIPVGDHAQSLLQSLNEVHLMESLHHENLVGYQHAWIENWKEPRRWGPEVPTLFVLMMAANGGSLADWISRRAGEGGDGGGGKMGDGEDVEDEGKGVKSSAGGGSERKKIETLKAALRQRRAARSASTTSPNPSPAPPTTTTPLTNGAAIHLLRTEEIYSLLHDIVSGLSFLHSRGILHLDIKPGNILLHWDEDSLIPRALLSDFGSSLFLHDNWTRVRSGHTGTMEYMSPEAVLVNPLTGKLDELSSKSDVWSVGMILHLLVFFRLPWEGDLDDLGRLRGEIGRYKGFSRSRSGGKERGRGDEVLLGLLERMLQVEASKRPSCEDVLEVLRARRKEGKKERRKRGRESGEKSSLALYRPAALPPLPLSPGETGPSFPIAGRSVARQVAQRLPRESLAVTFALLKILSPHLLAYALPTTSSTQATLLQTDTINLLILVLALVDLATASARDEGRGRRGVGVVCRVGHALLLLVAVGRRWMFAG